MDIAILPVEWSRDDAGKLVPGTVFLLPYEPPEVAAVETSKGQHHDT